jgi:hypothetical protein
MAILDLIVVIGLTSIHFENLSMAHVATRHPL